MRAASADGPIATRTIGRLTRADVAAAMGEVPEERNHPCDVAAAGGSQKRYRGRKPHAKGQDRPVDPLPQITMRERCGNAGAVESVESQRQASHSFHEPLGNLANGRRDSHISTAPTTRAMEKW